MAVWHRPPKSCFSVVGTSDQRRLGWPSVLLCPRIAAFCYGRRPPETRGICLGTFCTAPEQANRNAVGIEPSQNGRAKCHRRESDSGHVGEVAFSDSRCATRRGTRCRK